MIKDVNIYVNMIGKYAKIFKREGSKVKLMLPEDSIRKWKYAVIYRSIYLSTKHIGILSEEEIEKSLKGIQKRYFELRKKLNI